MKINEAIKARGMTMTFIEKEAGIPLRRLSLFANGHRELPEQYKPALKKVLKKYKINYTV